MIKKIFIVLSVIIIFFGDAYGYKESLENIGGGYSKKTYTDKNGQVVSTSTIDNANGNEFGFSIEIYEKKFKNGNPDGNSEKKSEDKAAGTESEDKTDTESKDKAASTESEDKAAKNLNNENSKTEEEAKKIKSEAKAKKDFAGKEYMIDLDNFGILTSLKKDTAQKTTENVLQTIITKMIVAFGVLALFIMTIGGGYMIFSHGQDELLSKGKGIFTSGLISLVIALSSGIIIKIVISLLY